MPNLLNSSLSFASVLLLAGCAAAPVKSTIADVETEGAALTLGNPDPSCSDFCVKVEQITTKVGEDVSGTISWRSAPKNAVLSISLERADDKRQAIQNARSETSRNKPGTASRFDGNLITNSVPISGDGTIRFEWSGNGFGCYRTEIAEICPGEAEPGPHVISAVVLDKTTVVHPFADPDVARKAKPKVIFSGRSSTFTIR